MKRFKIVNYSQNKSTKFLVSFLFLFQVFKYLFGEGIVS
jgi:hypothetical protein